MAKFSPLYLRFCIPFTKCTFYNVIFQNHWCNNYAFEDIFCFLEWLTCIKFCQELSKICIFFLPKFKSSKLIHFLGQNKYKLRNLSTFLRHFLFPFVAMDATPLTKLITTRVATSLFSAAFLGHAGGAGRRANDGDLLAGRRPAQSERIITLSGTGQILEAEKKIEDIELLKLTRVK